MILTLASLLCLACFGHNFWKAVFAVELLFLALDLIVLSVQLRFKAITVSKGVFWLFVYWVAPVLGFFVWIITGRAVFLKRVATHENEDIETVDRLVSERSDDPCSHMARTLCAAGALRYSEDSHAEYLGTGSEFFEALWRDIQSAKHSVLIECYIIKGDEFASEFIDLLCMKASEGCEVKVLFDDIGYHAWHRRFLHRIRKAGGEGALFHTVLGFLFSPKKNYRLHRKTFVIDGRIAYEGGFNISEDYLGRGPNGSWRDGAVRVTGPQALQMRRLFADDWMYTTGKHIDMSYDVPSEPAGNMPLQVLPGNPLDREHNGIHAEFDAFCRFSLKTLWIETPYFVPPKTILNQMCALAASGADVRVIFPRSGDHVLVDRLNEYYAHKAMKSGVKVFRYGKGFLHTKLILGDKKICSVGSANFDNRSVFIDFEASIIAYSEELGAQLDAILNEDLAYCDQYSREEYLSRPLRHRLTTVFALIFNSQM